MCDTFVALPSITSDGSIILAKNSDREPNETQALEYIPARAYDPGTKLRCTYMEIPQAEETFAVIIGRPFWMWGAEMGANEKGVAIGNEAVFTKMPINRKSGLTGMDLLRLALERSAKASEAMESIIRNLHDYGQGGICGFEDKKMAYHNSFIIADPDEAWVLETAGPIWAALKVKDYYAISNGLTIGEHYDEAHPDIIDLARKKRWLKKGADFSFANAYSDRLFTTFSACRARRKRSNDLLGQSHKLDIPSVMDMLRDHGREDYQPDSHFLIDRLCVHAANGLTRNSQTTGSLIAHLQKEKKTYWATGTSSPCLSVFKPLWFDKQMNIPSGPAPAESNNESSLWRRHEILHRSVILDYRERSGVFMNERDRLQQEFIQRIYDGNESRDAAFVRSCFEKDRLEREKWIDVVQNTPVKKPAKAGFRRYWMKQNKKAGIVVR